MSLGSHVYNSQRFPMKNPPRRFCRQGHDKWQVHGSYIGTNRNGDKSYVYEYCAVCKRERTLARYYKNKEKESELV